MSEFTECFHTGNKPLRHDEGETHIVTALVSSISEGHRQPSGHVHLRETAITVLRESITN